MNSEATVAVILSTLERLARQKEPGALIPSLVRLAAFRHSKSVGVNPTDTLPREVAEILSPLILHFTRRDRLFRFHLLRNLLDQVTEKPLGPIWLSDTGTMQILNFLGNSENVRFSYALSLRPWFEFAARKHLANTPAAKGRVQFVADGEVGLLAQDMALLLGMTNRFPAPDVRKPFERGDEATDQRFAYEVICPPDDTILDLSQSGKAVKRRASQAIAIDDAMRNAHGRLLLLVSETTLSRRVGDTAIAKARLVRSRRVQAVLAVPGGILGKHVGRDCHLLVLSPTAEPAQTIRFLNLGHSDLATTSPRRQRIAKREVNWNAFVEGQPDDVGNAEYFNEVSYDEVNDSEFPLSPARQIHSPSKKTVEAFLARGRKERLGDLVSFIRPRALPVAEDGDV